KPLGQLACQAARPCCREQPCHRAARPVQGKPVARRGRKARGLHPLHGVSPAASAGTSSGGRVRDNCTDQLHRTILRGSPHRSRRYNAMLARIRKAQEEGEGGFTLIELLVVMSIIGILAALAIR